MGTQKHNTDLCVVKKLDVYPIVEMIRSMDKLFVNLTVAYCTVGSL